MSQQEHLHRAVDLGWKTEGLALFIVYLQGNKISSNAHLEKRARILHR